MNSQKRFSSITDDGLQRFCGININILNRHALRKRKLARGNQMPLITKDLSKAMMKRSSMCNNFLQNRTGGKNLIYKTKLLRRSFEKI